MTIQLLSLGTCIGCYWLLGEIISSSTVHIIVFLSETILTGAIVLTCDFEKRKKCNFHDEKPTVKLKSVIQYLEVYKCIVLQTINKINLEKTGSSYQ